MNKTFMDGVKVSLAYKTNALIYTLKRIPLIKRFIKDSAYSDKDFKKFARMLAIIFTALKMISYRIFYFAIVFFIGLFTKGEVGPSFITVLYIFTFIGIIINAKLLDPKPEKYLMIVLFNVDAKEYMKSELFIELIKNFTMNYIILTFMSHTIGFSSYAPLLLSILTIPARIICESWDFKKYKYYSGDIKKKNMNSTLIGTPLLALCILPYFGFYVNDIILFASLIILTIYAIYEYKYLNRVDDYKLIYKRINTLTNVMQEETHDQNISIKLNDIAIDKKKLSNKHGYDLFNTIFIERHRTLLYKSARNISLVLAGIYALLVLIIIFIPKIRPDINSTLLNGLSFFPLAFYYINRGQQVTKAMFYNSDVAMLKYNFFRKPKVILGLFRRRLKSLVVINLLPAIVIGVGNTIILFLSGGTELITYVSCFIYVIALTTFFSIHYLVLYYLLQPFSESMTIKKGTYTMAVMLTYMISYWLRDIRIGALYFSVFGTLFAIIYIAISYILVVKFAPKTFK